MFKVDWSYAAAVQRAIQAIRRSVPLIVEDGSDYLPHQLASFSFLFEGLLEKGGIYIVEDIERSCWKTGEILDIPPGMGCISVGLLFKFSGLRWIISIAIFWINRSLIEY